MQIMYIKVEITLYDLSFAMGLGCRATRAPAQPVLREGN